jgi:G patch domain-containing protein 1
VHSLKAIIQPQQQLRQRQQRGIGQRSAPLSADERGALLGEQPVAAAAAAAAGQQQEGWGVGASAGAQAAGQAGQPQQALRRQLLQVAEGDRSRLQQLLSRSFVAAETQDMMQPGVDAAANAGLRPGAPARAPPPTAAEAVAAAKAAAAEAAAASVAGPGPGSSLALRQAQGPQQQQERPPQRLSVRRSEEWRPAALLCKRLNVPDPYQGRPAELQVGVGW